MDDVNTTISDFFDHLPEEMKSEDGGQASGRTQQERTERNDDTQFTISEFKAGSQHKETRLQHEQTGGMGDIRFSVLKLKAEMFKQMFNFSNEVNSMKLKLNMPTKHKTIFSWYG